MSRQTPPVQGRFVHGFSERCLPVGIEGVDRVQNLLAMQVNPVSQDLEDSIKKMMHLIQENGHGRVR